QHFHHAVLFLLHHTAHHLHAVEEDEDEHEIAEEEADPGTLLVQRFNTTLIDVEHADRKRAPYAAVGFLIDALPIELGELDRFFQFIGDGACGIEPRPILVPELCGGVGDLIREAHPHGEMAFEEGAIAPGGIVYEEGDIIGIAELDVDHVVGILHEHMLVLRTLQADVHGQDESPGDQHRRKDRHDQEARLPYARDEFTPDDEADLVHFPITDRSLVPFTRSCPPGSFADPLRPPRG